MLSHVNRLAHAENESVAHGDTLGKLLPRISYQHFANLPGDMVHRLIRMKVLEKHRLLDCYYLVAIDATGTISYTERHCQHCLTKTSTKTGKTIYYHPVLEAKLVTPGGLAFSIETEFIENPAMEIDQKGKDKLKQDCELKAFYRLANKLKQRFPQLNICLTMDGLYAAKGVFDVCKKYHWKFIIVFKKGSMPATYEEFQTLCKLQSENRTIYRRNKIIQDFSWANDIDYKNHLLHAIQCLENKPNDKTRKFVWITNLNVSIKNVITIANNGGRTRWKIENQGFNTQKNGGYNLEHAYSKNHNAGKCFYLLLQAAHNINQLIEKGSLLKNIKKTFGSIKNLTASLLESFRNNAISSQQYECLFQKPFQIRLDSS